MVSSGIIIICPQNIVNSSCRLFVKTTDFQLVFNFEQTCAVTIFGERGYGSFTMRALELHYPMIQFSIKFNIHD